MAAGTGINFGAALWMILQMQKRNKPTCVVPIIPSHCLHKLAGWLLKGLVDCGTKRKDGEPVTCFYVDEWNYKEANIDNAFIRYFQAEPDTSLHKAALLTEDECLATDRGLTVGTEIKIATLDLNDLFQRVVAHARSNPSCKQFTVLYTAGFVQPEDFISRCMLITADEIRTISYEEWLLKKAEDSPPIPIPATAALRIVHNADTGSIDNITAK